MVRAAVTGAIDYSRADPRDRHWRIKHRLVLEELQRADDQKLLEYTHAHWCAYVSHGGLKETSFKTAKEAALRTLRGLQNVISPWTVKPENEGENSTIDSETSKLVKVYKQALAKKANDVPEQQAK